ncbi:maleylacetoacetate isomerase [Blastomonas sp. UPD001]|jgi:maleylacetoacetate isomerase|uniref:maleylacetoacetate isomerase n=1 Tax=Blastomonas sp. UPD001 TaxID=2217673 RepID=UPI000E34C7AF|nr:maleylacetoacetate isomerase [Blastomonas sp. UPD001]MBL0965802.1 maleylacetoacetate isomerase [Blastomonas sp.]
MSDIILFDYWRSSASYRVRIALNLKGIAYQAVPTDLLTRQQKAPDYVARNPQGLVPMLHIDGHDLTQSLAIIDYLDATRPEPRLIPADPVARAGVLARAMIIIADIHPVNNLRMLHYLKNEMGQDQTAIDSWYRHWIAEGFAALEQLAPETGLFGGAAPDLTDVCLVPQVANARRFELDMTPYPRLTRIDAELQATPAFAAAHPERVKPA